MSIPPPNGQHRIAAWVAGAFLVPIVLSVFSMLLSSVVSTGQRVSGLEAEFREIKNNLERIDRKLDWLLEHHKP